MAKPILTATGTTAKSQGLVGDGNGQVATWSSAGQEWVSGPGVSGTGGGGQTFFFNFGNQTNITPNSVVPQSTGSNPTTSPSLLGPTYNATATAVTYANVPYSATAYTLIAGFVTAPSVPNVTQIFSGLWDFNIWMAATGATNGPTQMSVTARVYIMSGNGLAYGNAAGGAGAGVPLAVSDDVYLYDQKTLAQYILNVTMPQTVILATDRIYIELYARRNESSGGARGIDIRFETARPSHVHTTIQVPVNLATDVSGILPTANGGTGAGTGTFPSINTVFAGASTGSAALPTFRPLVAADLPTTTIAKGGTNLTSYTQGDLLYASATDTLAKRTIGLTGQVLTVSGGLPTWASPATSGTVTSVSTVDTGMGLTLTTTNGTTTPQITLGGVLAVAKGGTGAITLTGYVKGSGTASLFASATIPATDVTSIPYDVSGEVGGTPTVSTEVFHFKAVRAWSLAASGHQGGQVTNPSTDVVCTVYKNASSIGTITFGASGTFSSSVSATSFAAGDILKVMTPSAINAISNPYFTFVGTVG